MERFEGVKLAGEAHKIDSAGIFDKIIGLVIFDIGSHDS